MTTFAYCRVSSQLQADANGTDAQRDAITRWLTYKAIDPGTVRWFEDLAESGKDTDRPGWQSLMAALRDKGPHTLIVYDLSRCSRKLADITAWVKEMIALEVRVVFIKDDIDMSTMNGRLMLHMLGAVAEWQRESIIEKTRDGIRARRARGEKHAGARLPVGAKGGPKLTPEQIETMRDEHARGAKIAALAARYGVGRSTVRKRVG